MSAPTPEQIAKLPKWAQEHIADLERRTVVAERTVKEYLDNQTKSEFFYEDYLAIGGGTGPTHVTRYIQTHKISVARGGIRCDILLRQDDPGIEISWSDEGRGCREVAMVPESYQKIRLVSKEGMRR